MQAARFKENVKYCFWIILYYEHLLIDGLWERAHTMCFSPGRARQTMKSCKIAHLAEQTLEHFFNNLFKFDLQDSRSLRTKHV